MRSISLAFLSFLFICQSAFGNAVIFDGSTRVKTLKQNVSLNGAAYVLSGTVDPSSSATSAPAGSLYLNTTSGIIYRKTDAGSSTNWLRFATTTGTETLSNKTISTASNTIESGAASSGQVLTANGSSGTSWTTPAQAPDQSYEISNLSLASTVGSNAITFALKTKAGTDATGSDIIKIGFRNSTLATGTYVQRTVTGALSFVLSSGSTGGHYSGAAGDHYIYAIDNAGTVELGRCGIILDEGVLQTSTAEGGAGAADSLSVLYSTTARTDKAVRLIGKVTVTQATAGTHATAPSAIAVTPFKDDVKPFVAVGQTPLAVNNGVAIKWPTTIYQRGGGNYDSTTGLYTTARTGYYRVTVITSAAFSAGNIIYASVNADTTAGADLQMTPLSYNNVVGLPPAGGSGIVRVNAVGDTISVRPSANQSGGGGANDTVTIEWIGDL